MMARSTVGTDDSGTLIFGYAAEYEDGGSRNISLPTIIDARRAETITGPLDEYPTDGASSGTTPVRCQWIARCTNDATHTVTYRQDWSDYRSGPWSICEPCYAAALARGQDVREIAVDGLC